MKKENEEKELFCVSCDKVVIKEKIGFRWTCIPCFLEGIERDRELWDFEVGSGD